MLNRRTLLLAAFAPFGFLSFLSNASHADPGKAIYRSQPFGLAREAGRDPSRASQWALDAISVESGWLRAGLSNLSALSGPPIALIDSGVDASHQELRGRIRACGSSRSGRVTEGDCRDEDGHGTHVAGIAAAATGNGIGISGVAATSPLIICRALGSHNSGTADDVAACVTWAARKGAKVISMSLGGPDSRPVHAAIRAAWAGGGAAGSLIVASAGNDGPSQISYPAGYSEVVSVAAIGRDRHRARFSDTNGDVEIAAPGVDILSLKAGGGYLRMSGTSMAAPHVAGAAALLWATAPRLTAAGVRRLLDRSVSDLGSKGRDRSYGFGVLDLSQGG